MSGLLLGIFIIIITWHSVVQRSAIQGPGVHFFCGPWTLASVEKF